MDPEHWFSVAVVTLVHSTLSSAFIGRLYIKREERLRER
jgi:hypothetical protein